MSIILLEIIQLARDQRELEVAVCKREALIISIITVLRIICKHREGSSMN